MRVKKLKENELPGIPLGPFTLRIPGIHYKIEKVEAFQGLIIGTTALSAIPYLTEYLGLPYELAWSCVIIEVFLYILHATLGDPVVPGWITPTLPLTIAYLMNFEIGTERIHALMALQILVGIIFLFMGITKLADSFVKKVPPSIKAGILIAAPITVIQSQLLEGGQFLSYPIAITAGFVVLAVISFSAGYQKYRAKSKILDMIGRYGNLFPYLIAMVIGIVVGELSMPQIEIGSFIKIPDFGGIIESVSVFGIGLPSFDMFINAIPLAFVCYIIAFGDFVTTETLVDEAREARDDEYIDFNSSRSNLISGIRNIILGFLEPFPPLAGPLWVGMTVSVSIRYKEGKKAMKSLIGGMGSFRIATFISVICIPVVTFMSPIFPVGAALTLLFQAFVCARIGMEYCESATDRSIAGMIAAVLAFKGSAWALVVGFFLNIILGNMELPFVKKRQEKLNEDL